MTALAADYRLLAVDLPGHARSARPRGRLTVARMAAALDTLLAHLGEERVHVVGLSLGGCVGLALALHAPGRVRSLTLVNAFARLEPAHAGARLRLGLRGLLLAAAPMSAVGALVARTVFPGPEQAALRRAATASVARTSRAAYAATAAALAAFDVRSSLGRVRCPTMVIAGLEDRTVGLEAKEALAHAIAGARWVLVPGSGHVTTADRPAAFNAVLAEFLAAH